jgi:hypothetical protein
VKDWANGEAGDIGELQVVSGSVGTGYSTGSDTAAAAADASQPFFQQLGQHAQYLEVRVDVSGNRCLHTADLQPCAYAPQLTYVVCVFCVAHSKPFQMRCLYSAVRILCAYFGLVHN